MTQLTKVTTKPDHITTDQWFARLIACDQAKEAEDGHYTAPNLYGALFIDFTARKIVTTIIFNDETDTELLKIITQSFEKIHNILTKQL
jgi:hypothetical protein